MPSSKISALSAATEMRPGDEIALARAGATLKLPGSALTSGVLEGVFENLDLRMYVDYANGLDSYNGHSPVRAKKTVQAAYNALVTEALASYSSIGSTLGVGRIEMAPGDHDVGVGIVIDQRYPVEIIGQRSGWGNWTARDSSTRIVSSSAAVVQLILTGSASAVTYGNRFVGIGFAPNPAVNVALTACIRAQANTHLRVERCSFDLLNGSGSGQAFYAIEQTPGVSAQDNAWARIRDNVCARMGFYKATTGTNYNRMVIDGNVIGQTHANPAIHLQGDFYQSTVSNNNIEGNCPAITCDAGLADHNVFINNSGEMADDTYPFYDINSAHQDSLFLGGHCTSGSANGRWVDFDTPTSGNIVIAGGVTIAGSAGYKRKFVDNSTNKVNWLINQQGFLAKMASGAGKTKLADSDFITTPDNGAWGYVRNTTDSKIYHSVKMNGSWFSVEML